MNFWAMAATRTFQVFIFALASLAALCTLMALGTITTDQGMPAVFTIIGFGIGIPVTTKSNAP